MKNRGAYKFKKYTVLIFVLITVLLLTVNDNKYKVMASSNKSESSKVILNKVINQVKGEGGSQKGEYEVSLSVNKVGVDIVLAIDNSHSMGGSNNKWNREICSYFIKLVESLFDLGRKYNKYVRVGLITYSGSISKIGSIDDATIIQTLSHDVNEVVNSIKNINTFGEGSGGYKNNEGRYVNFIDPLNIEAALLRSKDVFENNDSEKYVFLYADGPPTISIGRSFSKVAGGNSENTANTMYLEYEADTIRGKNILVDENINVLAFGEKANILDYIYDNNIASSQIRQNTADVLKGITTIEMLRFDKHEDVFFQGSSGQYNWYIFDYVKNYSEKFIENAKSIENIENIRVIDGITADFKMIENAYGAGKTSIISNNNGEIINIDEKINENSEFINWNNLLLDDDGIIIKYKIKQVDDYLIGENLLSSIKGSVDWEENGESNKIYFNNPVLNIKTLGRINVFINEENISINNNENNDDKIFTIKLENVSTKEKVEFQIKCGEEKQQEFTLGKDLNSISNIKNGITAGKYRVSEVIYPSSYEGTSININGEDIDEFTFDKDNLEINITINTKSISIPIRGKLYVESNIKAGNNIGVSNNLSNLINNVINKSFDLQLENNDENAKYSFNLNLGDSIYSDIYIIEDYSKLPQSIDKSLNYIKEGNYKMKEILPMNIKLDTVEIKYNEDDQWKRVSLEDELILNSESNNIFIRLSHSITNNKYWYKREELN